MWRKLSYGVLICLFLLLSGCVTEVTTHGRKTDPVKYLQALIDLGNGYIRNGEYAWAKNNLNKALELNPRSAEAHHAFANLFQVEGEKGLAEQYYKKSIRLSPKYSQARNNYGAFLYSEGRYAEAEKQLLVAVGDHFYANRAGAFENLGVNYLKLDKRQDAENAFLRSVQLNPRQSRALLELSDIRLKQKNYVEARQYYQRHDDTSSSSARSLWVCIQLARVFSAADREASCSITLRNIFPNTPQYREYQGTVGH